RNEIYLHPSETLMEDGKLGVEMKEDDGKIMSAEEGDDDVLISMSALKEEGVIVVKNVACKSFLEQRV
ncbi:hypothetical protein KI387_013712, partial [Taxus chinensis]